jgi:hypothetical protein
MPDQGEEFIGSIFCEQYNCQAEFYLEPSHSGEPRPATGTGVRHLIALYGEGYTGPADRSLTENGRRGSRSVFQTVGLSSNFSIFSWRRSTKHLFQSGKRRPGATVSTCSNRYLAYAGIISGSSFHPLNTAASLWSGPRLLDAEPGNFFVSALRPPRSSLLVERWCSVQPVVPTPFLSSARWKQLMATRTELFGSFDVHWPARQGELVRRPPAEAPSFRGHLNPRLLRNPGG